jgi:hypothetical protein
VVERTLSPAHWHYRLPFFGVEIDENLVQARGATQEIIDQEIEYASQAGLDYWAFVFYKPDSGLDAGRNLYLSSTRRSEINFCLVIDSGSHLADAEMRALFINYFKMAEYQTVIDGRPLFYIFSTNGLNKDGIDTFKNEVRTAGLPAPYFVFMGWSSAEVAIAIEANGLDAGSQYAQLGSNGAPFAQMTRHAEIAWETYRKAGIKVVPWVSTGWDPRPRVENPTPWATYPAAQWAETATPDEIAAHLKNALAWNAAHPDEAEANAVIIYAWNEFDEGGWLCPTLYNGTDRINAVGSVLNQK